MLGGSRAALGRLRGCGGRLWRGRRRAAGMAGGGMGQRMVWVDLEMTGLDVEKDQILEMACLITDCDLNVLAEGPNLIINQPDELLDGMSEWCKEHHGKSGLTKAVKESKISLQQAEYEFLSFVRQQTPPGLCPLAGNSVHADKKFLDKYMPQFMRHLHYRIIDVSTVKELCRRWYPEEYEFAPKKAASHSCALPACQRCRAPAFRVPASSGSVLAERSMTSGKASKNCSSTETASSRGKRMKRRGN
ncbi:oligoribonuclease, mitochondrial isoform X1 [Columba livia]|uniref:oligoribonuclease, mitochondrial isoform X1 n=1 Tax=Columba livia TaxID=8932 RepID=UPI0031BA0072